MTGKSTGQSSQAKNEKTTVKRSTKLFISGVLVLTVANIVNKILGLCFKIPLERIVSREGMGYFNQAYTIYTWLYMVSTTGLPTAVSMLISESRALGDIRGAKRVFRVTIVLFIIIGAIGTIVMMGGAGLFSVLTKSPNAKLSIIYIGPTLFFICIASALRGYFQGYQQMVPTAVSQFIESLCKLVIGVIFAKYAISQGYSTPKIAAYAILGITIGAGVGAFYLLLSKWFFNESKYNEEYLLPDNAIITPKPVSTILKRLIIIAVPITISASMMSMTEFIDLAVLMRRLQGIGLTEAAANALYGNWKTCVVPMFNMPLVLIYPISYSLVPMIRATITRGEVERTSIYMHTSIRICAILSLPCALGMSVMAKPILSLIFSKEGATMGAPLLMILSPSIFFVSMLSISNALLQASGHERKPIISMAAGAVVKLLATYLLVGLKIGVDSAGKSVYLGIYGTPIGTFLCYMAISAINMYYLIKHVGVKLSFSQMFMRPLLAAVLCSAAAYGTYYFTIRFIPLYAATLLGIGIAVIIYVIAIFKLGTISREELELLPSSSKIIRILERVRLI